MKGAKSVAVLTGQNLIAQLQRVRASVEWRGGGGGSGNGGLHLMADVSGAHSLAVDHQRYIWAFFARALALGQDAGAFGASWRIVLEGLVGDVGENEGRQMPSRGSPKCQGKRRRCCQFPPMKHCRCGLKDETKVDTAKRMRITRRGIGRHCLSHWGAQSRAMERADASSERKFRELVAQNSTQNNKNGIITIQ